MGQKHSGGARIGNGRTVVVVGGDVGGGRHLGGDGDGRINEEDESETPETCVKSFSDNNLAWYSRPWKIVDAPTESTHHRKPPSVEVLTSSPPSTNNNAPTRSRGRQRPTSAGQSRDRPSSGLFWRPPPMPWFGRSASKTTGGSSAMIACSDLTDVINAQQQRPVRPATVVGAPGNSDDDDVTYRSIIAAAGKEKQLAAVEEAEDGGLRPANGATTSGGTIIEEVLRQTVDFLVHEIEPVLIAEYLKHQRRSRRRNLRGDDDKHGRRPNGIAPRKCNGAGDACDDVAPSPPTSPAFMNERELRALLADIILGPSATDDADFRRPSDAAVIGGRSRDEPPSEMSPSSAGGWTSEDEFWTFCRLLRKLDADRKSGEFLEALGAVLRIVAPCRCCHCSGRSLENGSLPGSPRVTCSGQQNSALSSGKLAESEFRPKFGEELEILPNDIRNVVFKRSSGDVGVTNLPVCGHDAREYVPDISDEDDSDPDDDVSDAITRRRHRQFDVTIVYVDSETRVPRPFDDVAQLKRGRRRKSRIGHVDKENEAKLQQQQQQQLQHHQQQRHPTAVVGDLADRYVPMLVVRVSGLNQLCEMRTRRIEHLLDDFPDRILRLTIADVDLDPSSTLRLSRAVERHPATGLRTLRVVRSSLGNDGATLLATGLSRNTGLRSLSLAGNGMTSRGCAIVVRALLRRAPPSGTGGRTLTDLDLSDNPGIGDVGLRSLLSALRAPGCPLQRLTVRRIGISPSAAGELFAALGRNSRLVALDVGGNRLVDCGGAHANRSPTATGAKATDAERSCADGGLTAFVRLTESLIVNRTLKELFVDDECGATVAECRQLARALRTNTALRRLRLDGNAAIGDAGAEMLADGLRYNRGGIEELGLAGCSIGDRGLAAIVDATTRYNSTAKLVDLRRRLRRRRGGSTCSPPPQHQHQSECFGSTRGVVLLASPTSDFGGWPCPAETCNNNTAEHIDLFSPHPLVDNGNGTSEIQPAGTTATPTVHFDRQLVDLVEGLSRPRILVD